MAEFDAILKKWTNPEKNYIHGASFVAYDKTGRMPPIREVIPG